MLWFQMYPTNHNEILHTSRQLHCRDMCQISLWLVEHILNSNILNFDRISNSNEKALVERAPGARPTNDISIEFEIRPNLTYSVLKCSLPIITKCFHCRDVWKNFFAIGWSYLKL